MGRLAYIDVLRAVAVLMVVGLHAGILPFGYLGVELFFSLSGFCLSYPTLARLHRDGSASFDLRAFAARRLVRIVPPYYAAIAMMLLVVFVVSRAHLAVPSLVMIPYGFSWIDVAKQMLFIDFHTSYLNLAFWSLSFEFHWYIAFPLLLWLYVINRWLCAIVPASSLIVYLMLAHPLAGTDFKVPLAELAALPTFMFGIVLADLHIKHDLPDWSAAMHLAPLRVLQFIGVASYSIYLAHEPLMWLIHGFFQMALPVAALLALVPCIAFWYAFERPFVETPLRDRCIEKLETLFRSRRLTSTQSDSPRVTRPLHGNLVMSLVAEGARLYQPATLE